MPQKMRAMTDKTIQVRYRRPLVHAMTFVFAITTAALSAADLYVPTIYHTIQSAINAAGNGDKVKIAPGIYYENIYLTGRNITIEPFNDNFDTVIDGLQLGPVVTFSGAETSKCVLKNLVIQNGRATNGGGIVGNGAVATINKCTIIQNIATGDGGGIYGFDGTIKNSTIVENLATNGGGMAGCTAFVDNCKIRYNQANYAGGGIYGYDGQIQFSNISNNVAAVGGGGIAWGTGILYRNKIESNTVTATGTVNDPGSFGGGVVYSMGMMVSNTIRYNLSLGDGGGVAFCSDLMWNNVIAENFAKRGGGMAYCSGRIENNTIWANEAQHKGGGCLDLTGAKNSIIYANVAPTDSQWSGINIPTYSCIQGWAGGQPDILIHDPQLVAPDDGDYGLQPSSPCIDAGTFIADLPNDYLLDPRGVNGTNIPRGDGSDFDIGADEYMPPNLNIAASWGYVTTTYTGPPGNVQGVVSAQLVVQNVGTENIPGTFNVQMYGSADAILHVNDVPLHPPYLVNGLAPGETKTIDFYYVLPLNLIVTGYHLIAQVDPGGTLLDILPGDNIAISGPQP